jgi:isochorismate hydrolase
MRSDLALTPKNAMLLVIDVQERLASAMHPELLGPLLENLTRLGKASELLELPVLMSEQYPKGLGQTVDQVKAAFPRAAALAKMSFDAVGDDAIRGEVAKLARPKIIVAGMEAHICVYQTVRSLAKDHEVHVLRDAVASRTVENHGVGLKLAEAAGAVVTSTETVLFDLLGKAGTDAFKTISKLVR